MQRHRFTDRVVVAALLSCAGWCASARANPTVYPLVMGGEFYSSGFLVNSASTMDGAAINDSGQWAVNTSLPSSVFLVVRGTIPPGGVPVAGSVFLLEGDPSPVAGSTYSSFDTPRLNVSGNYGANCFLAPTAPLDSGVLFNTMMPVRETDIATAPQFSANTPYIGFFETHINDANQLMIVASVDDPAIASTVDRAMVLVDSPAGASPTQTVLMKEADAPIAGRLVTDFATGPQGSALANGHALFIADLDGDTADDSVLFDKIGPTAAVLAREGSAAPAVPGRLWGSILSAAVDVNNNGDWAIRGTLNAPTTDDLVIVKNGTQLIAREGQSITTASGTWALTAFGTGCVGIDGAGNVYWFGDWNDTDTSIDTGLFRNGQLIVQEGVTTAVTGEVVSAISSVQSNFFVSDNGRWLVFEGTLFDSVNALARQGAILVDLGGAARCNRADITDIGDTGAGPDNQLTVDDIIAFVNTFGDATGCPGAAPCNRADITDIGDTGAGPDGELTVDDIIAFVNAFGDGC